MGALIVLKSPYGHPGLSEPTQDATLPQLQLYRVAVDIMLRGNLGGGRHYLPKIKVLVHF